MWRRVPYPVEGPGRCWFQPAVGADDPEGFIESAAMPVAHNFEVRAYLSVRTFKEIAERLGYVPAVVANHRIARSRRELEQAQAEIIDLKTRLDAVKVLKQTPDGFVEARPVGRPPRQKVAG